MKLQQRQALLLSLCICCCFLFSVEAFRSGDLVRTKKQSFFGGVPTAWTEVVAHDSPRFLQPRSLRLPSLDSQEDRLTSYKVAFSFADDRFITPLITISDGKGALAESVTFTFIYSGNTIIDLRWTAEHRQGIGEKQEHFFIYYEWERYSELDSEAGMAFLFLSGFTLGAAMFAYVLISSGLETRPGTQLPTRVVQRGSVQPTPSTVSDNSIPSRHRSYAREPASPAVVLSPEPFASSETTGPVLAISPAQEEPFPPFTEFVGSSSLGSTTLPPTLQDHHSQEHSRKSD